LGGVVIKPNPNIWWVIDLIKSENTHFTLLYHRLKDNYDIKGFKERKRDPREIQKDLELTKLKNRYLKNEFDVIEYNRRVAFYMHDHSGKVKQLTKATDDIQQNAESTITTKATDDIQPNPYLGFINHTDITEDFLANIEAESACVNNVSEKLDTSLRISKSQSVATEKSNKDVQCDVFFIFFIRNSYFIPL
jgi:hypothetical protein